MQPTVSARMTSGSSCFHLLHVACYKKHGLTWDNLYMHVQSFLVSFPFFFSSLSTGDSSYTLFLYFPLSGSTYSARVSRMVAVRVRRPIPETSFRRRVGRENIPAETEDK